MILYHIHKFLIPMNNVKNFFFPLTYLNRNIMYIQNYDNISINYNLTRIILCLYDIIIMDTKIYIIVFIKNHILFIKYCI